MNIIINIFKKLLRKSRVKKPPIDANYIIPRAHHTVSKTDISGNALKVLNRLAGAGYEAYLVGGSVRDLLLHQAPKDFDVATNATPNQIRDLFRNARIIGRRFKLAHILYHRDIIEVATFRGSMSDEQKTNERGMLIRDNTFGTLEEDAWRRDFTVNSLYYNIQDASIIDFTGGVDDIHKRHIRIIGDAKVRYQEDPVRMLRAIRFSAKLDFKISEETATPIYHMNGLIKNISGSRLFDEVTKLFQCGKAQQVTKLLMEFGLFSQLFPECHVHMKNHAPMKALLDFALENTDHRLRDNKPVSPAFIFAVLLWFPMLASWEQFKNMGIDPLPALDKAMSHMLMLQNKVVTIPKRYTQIIREMWLMQYRFPKRAGHRAFSLLEHPRFRASYDFLLLRALVQDESIELADWWTRFQDVSPREQAKMVALITQSTSEAHK